MAAQPVAIRDATNDQRVRIRSLLDKHFDDSLGMYLDGKSDQAIADEVSVPRLIVERIRDAAYGPVKTTAEQQAQVAEIERLRAELKRISAEVEALAAKLTKAA